MVLQRQALVAAIAISLAACVQGGQLGNLFFDDLESPRQVGDGKYAVGDLVALRITPGEGISLEGLTAASSNPAVLLVDPNLIDNGDNSLTLLAEVTGEGAADIQILDAFSNLVDVITVDTGFAVDVLAQPVQFGLESNKFLDVMNIFEGGSVEILTQLQEDVAGTLVPLKGQIPGDVQTEGQGFVEVVVEEEALLLGEAFQGDIDLVPLSFFRLEGLAAGGEESVTLSANGVLHSLTINTIPLNGDLIDLVVGAPDTSLGPVNSGAISAQAFLSESGEEVFGGNYSFIEVGFVPLLEITQVTPDFVVFTANGAGTSTVEIALVDAQGIVIDSVQVNIDVVP